MPSRADVENTLSDEIARADNRDLVIDMASVTFIDSTAISALVGAYRRAGQAGVRITVARPSRPVANVLRMTGLLDLFTDGDVPLV
jgi:anti-anti-sigma factor